MQELKVTLIGDGNSDKALSPIIKWLLDDLYPRLPNQIIFADFGRLRTPPKKGDIVNQVLQAQEYYPYDILVYHRDAEDNNIKTVERRKAEVLNKINNNHRNKVVCAVPVKMMEAWLLINEAAIKKASGNRTYKGIINLPSIRELETESRPKDKLHKFIKDATELQKRRLASFNVHKAVHTVAENIEDFTPLRSLRAFNIFEGDIKHAIDNLIKE